MRDIYYDIATNAEIIEKLNNGFDELDHLLSALSNDMTSISVWESATKNVFYEKANSLIDEFATDLMTAFMLMESLGAVHKKCVDTNEAFLRIENKEGE